MVLRPMEARRYLNDILRDELGFKGLIVSDWAAIKQLPGNQGKQIEAAINAGIDMAMVPDDYQVFIPTLINLVETERVSMSRIDDAVLKILTLKFEMGLFENPLTDRSNIEKLDLMNTGKLQDRLLGNLWYF
jgi:beta-glucosidase